MFIINLNRAAKRLNEHTRFKGEKLLKDIIAMLQLSDFLFTVCCSLQNFSHEYFWGSHFKM